ncbi:hypothetical protein E2C01_036519 [Portunus trituberculatus]|uniref:Uncharacterized protein n=1 Tax=Portunus trituberculatus TaxID=210409 RepID=A0A5B7FCP4_PORTR|nr:hypothetical protein [Portunus trituberculatus]
MEIQKESLPLKEWDESHERKRVQYSRAACSSQRVPAAPLPPSRCRLTHTMLLLLLMCDVFAPSTRTLKFCLVQLPPY